MSIGLKVIVPHFLLPIEKKLEARARLMALDKKEK